MTPAITRQQIVDALVVWNVRALVKLTAKSEHTQQLLEGKPYLRAIGDFRRDELGDGRSDPYEGMATTFMGPNPERAIFCMTWLSDPILPHFLATKDGQRIKSEFASGGAAVLITDPVEFLWRFQRAEETTSALESSAMTGTTSSPKTPSAGWTKFPITRTHALPTSTSSAS